jgi:hypothetical protein
MLIHREPEPPVAGILTFKFHPGDPMSSGIDDPHALYFHIRMMLGIVVGLALTHLLRGIARIIEHPYQKPLYWVHLVWVLSMFVWLLHFWWWQIRLTNEVQWTFLIFFFLVSYALLLYLLSALLFPEQVDEYKSYREYFYSRRAWFFAVLACVYAVDFYDTWLKGADYFHGLGIEYIVRNATYIVLCGVAIATRQPAFHATFAVAGLLYQVSWILRSYESLQ